MDMQRKSMRSVRKIKRKEKKVHLYIDITLKMNLLYVLVFTIVTAEQTSVFCFASTTTNRVNQNTCSSRFHCQTSIMKYLSHSQLNGYYLNATIIARNRTSNITNCQTFCLKRNGCFSININISLNKDYDCQLLSNNTNLHMNKSLLVKNKDFIHLYIKSPSCEKTMCKNDAACIPNYSNDSYSCQCKMNATFNSWGRHCENVSKGTKAADLFWSFDELHGGKFKSTSTKNGAGDNIMIMRKGQHLMMPGRLTPVLYCKPTTGNGCAQTERPVLGLNDLRGVEAATYSLWIKFTKKELKKNTWKNIITSSSRMGVFIFSSPDLSKGICFKIITDTQTQELWFAHKMFPYRWNHLAVTFKKDAGLRAYLNGVLNRFHTVLTNRSANFNFHAVTTLGLNNEWVCGIFIDDLAVWHSRALNESDVKEIYELGKP